MSTAPSSRSPDMGALDALEALVASDPGDDDLRRRYVEVAVAVGDPRRAAEALKGAIKRRKSSEVRERVIFDIAMLYLKDGELEPARQSLLDVVVAGAGGPAALAAARRLLELEGEPGHPKIKEVALEALTKLSGDVHERHEAATQLLALHATSPLKAARLASGYEALVDSPRADEALAWLRTYYAKKKDQNGLSEVYRTLALRSVDANEGRAHALESIRLAKDATPEKRAERWLWLVERFGPSREAFRQLMPLLEGAQRYAELRRVLEADVQLASPEERASILARLGDLLATRLSDVDAALDAFRRSLEADPKNGLARHSVEQMMRAGDRRLEAAAILEPLYQRERNPEGRLAVLETRASLQPYSGSRLLAFVEAVEVAAGAGLKDRALSACRNAINLDPSSPELQQQYDDLIRGSETPAERLARYEDALERATDPQRRSTLLYTVAAIRHAAGDVRGAMDAWQRILEQTPSDAVAFERLLDATVSVGDEDDVPPLLDRACASVGARERPGMVLRKAVWLADHGSGQEAAELCNHVVDEPLRPSQLEAIVQIARDQDEDLLHRHALELLSASTDTQASSQALEQLGDFQYERLGDRRAAATSWTAAAVAYTEGDREHAQDLFERALETLPDDLGAAERLIDLYASTGAWMQLLGTLRLFIRSGDLGRAAEQLLRFKDRAIEGGAADELLALASEILDQVGSGAPDWLTPLKKAQSRVLLADPGRQAEASQALRDLIESQGQPDDVRAFERFVDSNPSAEERHRERRWLARWREEHEADPSETLLESARAELDYGDPEAARSAYERVLSLHPEHAGALEAVCRLRFQSGDFGGGLAALQDLREHIGDERCLALTLRIVEWMWSERGRPGEAAQLLAPLLLADPPPGQDAPARVLARGMLGDPTIRDEVIEHLETFAGETASAERQILEFLVAARRATDGVPGARRRWLERIVELSADAPERALSYAIQGVLEAPDAFALWDAAEQAGRRLGRPEVVADAYRRAFVEHSIPAALAASLGPRMVTFEGDFSLDPKGSVNALLRVLEVSPEARWALDRVKLVLSADARWPELFDVYDRAIRALPSDAERAELLAEAAFAAKDLAGEPKRAIHYFEFLRVLRPDDAAVEGALERLYEKQGSRRELATLLARRAEHATGFRRRELEQRIAGLLVDLGDTARAHALVERLIAGGTDVAEAVPLLEGIARPLAPTSEEARAAAKRAIVRLRAHYHSLGRRDDLARVSEAALELAEGARERLRCARDWVQVLLPSRATPADLEAIVERVQSRIGGDAELAPTIFKTLLITALHAWRRGGSPEAAAGAQSSAYRLVETLTTLLVQGARPEAAARLLRRSSRLPFPRERKRDLLCRAAFVRAEVDAGGAVDLFDDLLDEDASDDVATRAMARFAEILDLLRAHAKLAARWEQVAKGRAKAGDAPAACAGWNRAGGIWEAHGDPACAIAAFRQGAALSSEASFEALARIHEGREEWRDAANALEWLRSHARNGEAHTRALRLADAYVKLGDSGRARACLEQELRTVPEGPAADPIRERLIALYRRDGVYEPLARLLASEAERSDALPQKLALVREACELLQTKLGKPAEATSLLKLAVTWAPRDEGLRRWLLEALESLSRWEEAAALLREQVAAFGEQRSRDRALVHQRLARSLVRATRAAEALVELRAAAEMFPGHASILHELARVALDAGEVDFAEATYRSLLFALRRPAREARDAGDAEPRRADVLLELAEIALRRGDGERGVELVDSAFDDALEAGGDLRALGGALLERGRHELLAREEERCAERGGTLAQRALALGRWLELWEQRLGRSPEAGARIRQNLRRITRDVEQEALSDASAWAALCRVRSVLGEVESRDRLASSLTSVISATKERADRGRLRVGLARLLLEEPPRNAAAIGALEEALADDPNDQETLEVLSDALEREGRFDELASVLERCVSALAWEAHAPPVRAVEWRLGHALEKAGRSSEARDLYEGILDREPTDRDLVSRLAARLDALGSERLADCLERWIAIDPTAAPGIANRVVELRDRRGDRQGAARALETAFSIDPTHADIRDRLIAQYEERGQWAEAAGALRRAIDASPKSKGLFPKLVEAYRRAGDQEALLGALDAALTRRSRDAELLALRAQAREERGDVAGAIADLESASTVDAKRLGALLDLLERVAARAQTPAEEAHLLRMAEILTRLNRPKEALAALERLRVRNPSHRDALHKIALTASATEDWGAAANAYRDLVALLGGLEPEKEALGLATALVDAFQRAGRSAEARGPLGRVVDAYASSPSAEPELVRLCEAAGDWGRLAELLVGRAERQSGADQKVGLLVQAARLRLEKGADAKGALSVIEQARAIAPGSTEALLVWSRAQVALGHSDVALAALGEASGKGRVAAPVLASLQLEIARAHLAADGLVEAWNALKAAFVADARHAEIALLLGLLSLDLEDEKTAERALTVVTKTASRVEPAQKARAYFHLARMAQAKGDVAKARLLASKAVESDPGQLGAKTLLAKLAASPAH